MSHEPECYLSVPYGWPDDVAPASCIRCMGLRAAYQRGQDDYRAALERLNSFDDDRCLCEGCTVIYVRHALAGRDMGICECGCYSVRMVHSPLRQNRNLPVCEQCTTLTGEDVPYPCQVIKDYENGVE